jgi:hypothetical protein
MQIFREEFDIEMLVGAKIIKNHFMSHNSRKQAIAPSWHRNKLQLMKSMIGNDFVTYMEPINLIADYYGEKQALYFAFLIHHIGWLMIPSAFGTLLFFVHVYLAYSK